MKRRILEILNNAKDTAEIANTVLWTKTGGPNAEAILDAANNTYSRAKRILEVRYGYYPNG